MRAYYEARAPEYDDWWNGTGLFAERDRPGWEAERDTLIATLRGLPPARTLDVACGTGFLTQHLQGRITGLDASPTSLRIAAERIPDASFVESDALRLPFEARTFDRLFTSHFYGHLEEAERGRFLSEADRVASELVVVDASRAHADVDEEYQPRVLNDGSTWTVYKRYFTSAGLAGELGGGEILHDGRWFVAVRTS